MYFDPVYMKIKMYDFSGSMLFFPTDMFFIDMAKLDKDLTLSHFTLERTILWHLVFRFFKSIEEAGKFSCNEECMFHYFPMLYNMNDTCVYYYDRNWDEISVVT